MHVVIQLKQCAFGLTKNMNKQSNIPYKDSPFRQELKLKHSRTCDESVYSRIYLRELTPFFLYTKLKHVNLRLFIDQQY